MEPLRAASIGLGWWGGTLATKARGAGIELVGCYARTLQARAEFAERHNTRAMSSLDELLTDPEIEAVILATPHTQISLSRPRARANTFSLTNRSP